MPVFPSIDHRHDVGHVTFVDHMTVITECISLNCLIILRHVKKTSPF